MLSRCPTACCRHRRSRSRHDPGTTVRGPLMIQERPSELPSLVLLDDGGEIEAFAEVDPGTVLLTCANCGAQMDERKCKLICRSGSMPPSGRGGRDGLDWRSMAAEPIPAPRPKTGIPKNPGRRELGMTAT